MGLHSNVSCKSECAQWEAAFKSLAHVVSYGVAGGDPDATESFLDSMQEKSNHPQNPWAQNRSGPAAAPQTGAGTGNAWAKGGGKLAAETKAINAAWGKR